MKKKLFLLTVIFFVFLLMLTGCATTPPTDSTGAGQLTDTFTADETPVLTVSPTPTETPPLPCTIAFDSDRDNNWEVYSMGPDGSNTVNLTNNPAEDRNPVWSPDGSQIAFVSNRDNGKEGGQFIYVMNADGSNVRQLTFDNGSDWPDWSNDGSRITYTRNDDIYVIDADGNGQPINLTNSPEKDWKSVWSPDGKHIAWLSGSGSNWNAFIMDVNGSNVKQITDNGNVNFALWTIDGRIITEWGWKDQQEFCHNCLVNIDNMEIEDGGGKGDIQRYLPFWTASNERVELADIDAFAGNNEIYLIGQTLPDSLGIGIGAVNLTNNPAQDRNANWPANCGEGLKAAVLPTPEKPKEPGSILIGYAGDDQWQQQRKADFKKACDELGIQCVYGDIPALIEQGVDAIVQNSNNIVVKGLHQDILNARDKGIPVFLLDAEVITDGSYSITVDQKKWVETSLEWMVEQMGGKGDFAFFDFQLQNVDTGIIEEYLKKYPDIRVVAKADAITDQNNIKPQVSAIVQGHPDLKAIWANGSITDVIFGVVDSGISSDKFPLLTCEATKEGLFIWKDRLKDFPGMRCIAVSNPPGIAYDAAYAAYYLVTGAQLNEAALGGEYGHSLYVDSPVITNDTLQSWIEKINYEDSKYIVDQLMSPEEIKEKWFLQ